MTEMTLAECPPGLFMFGETMGLKTEYRAMESVGPTEVPGDQLRWKVGSRTEAYVAESGEAFWGGASSKEDRENLLVRPIPIPTASPQAPAREGVEWQPVETALKDGTEIDLWGHWPEHDRWVRTPDAVWDAQRCDWKVNGFYAGSYVYPPRFTHWRAVTGSTALTAREEAPAEGAGELGGGDVIATVDPARWDHPLSPQLAYAYGWNDALRARTSEPET